MGSRYVEDAVALGEVVAHLREATWFALDTEFEREKTYYARLCLVQVATPTLVACIDPLAVPSLEPLREALFAPQICKVLHACSQDCEILYQHFGRVPGPLFDTQVAAPLLGHAEQVGYAALVEARLGVSLPKTHTRTDWCARPLSAAQIGYAEDDVRYLARLYPEMRDALAACGRLAWLREDFAVLSEPDSYAAAPAQAWRRLRGLQRLAPAAVARAQALAEWRERTAQRLDRPRGWILRDAALLELARSAPVDAATLAAAPDLPRRFGARYGDEVRRVLARAQPVAEPVHARPPPLTPAQSALLRSLQHDVERLAAAEHLDPAVLAGRRRLERVVRGEAPAQVFSGWRARLLVAPLERALAGT